jgi:hypothetical protein
MSSLNSKQIDVLKQDIMKGKKIADLQTKMDYFGVPMSCREEIYSRLLKEVKGISITELDGSFVGLQLSTDDDLNMLIQKGWTGDWEIDVDRAEKLNDLRVFSMKQRGKYFTAKIKRIVPLVNGKKRVYFSAATLYQLDNRNIKFTQNVVRYVNESYELN